MLLPRYPSEIAVILAHLFVDTTAHTVLLLNRHNILCAGQGNCTRSDLPTITAAIHAAFWSTSSPRSLLNSGDFYFILQQEAQENIFCAKVTRTHLLALLFDQGVPIALIKKRVGIAVIEINRLLTDNEIME